MTKKNKYSFFLTIFLTILIFVIDINTIRGINEGYFYVIPILITIWIPKKKYTIIAGVTAIILTFFGFYYSPNGVDIEISLANRFLAVLGSFVTMFTVLMSKEKGKLVEEINQELNKTILELKNANIELEQYAYMASQSNSQHESPKQLYTLQLTTINQDFNKYNRTQHTFSFPILSQP